jgi:hypothetical protein
MLFFTMVAFFSATNVFAKRQPYAITHPGSGDIIGYVCQDKEGGTYHQPCSACGLTPISGSIYQCKSSWLQKNSTSRPNQKK